MADFVKLTKRGLVSYVWNPDSRTYVPAQKGANNIPHLRLRCEIDEDVTLGDVFNAVQADPDLMEFIAQYSWCRDIEKFHLQARRPSTKKDTPEEDCLTHLEIMPYAEFWENQDGPERFEGISLHFSGLSSNNTSWSVSYSPMNELAHLPVRLLPTIKFSKAFKPEREAVYNMSLLEVLDAIYWDISFYGGPEENEEFLAMLRCSIDEIKSGEATCVPMDLDAIINGE